MVGAGEPFQTLADTVIVWPLKQNELAQPPRLPPLTYDGATAAAAVIWNDCDTCGAGL